MLVEPRELLDPLAAREAAASPARTSAARPVALRRLHGRPRRHVGEVLHRAHGAVRGLRDAHRRGLRAGAACCTRCRRASTQEHGLQCGFCTPGMMMRAYRLLQENPDPTEEEIRYWMAGNLCRCTGYQNIVKAVQLRGAEAARRPPEDAECRQGRRTRSRLTENRHGRFRGHARARTSFRAWATPALRKEDARFIQGKGNYVDDIKLPGMLFVDIVRSPYAHARIKTIDKSEALADARACVAVLTADDLKPLKLHWMPTLAGDVPGRARRREGALPDAGSRDGDRRRPLHRGRRRRGRWRSSTRSCPRSSTRTRRWRRARRCCARTSPARTRSATASATIHNHIFTWEAGDKDGTDAAFANARGHGARRDPLPARAPVSAGDLRLRRLVRPGDAASSRSTSPRRRRTSCAPWSRCCRAFPKRRSASSAPTSAAASATRCRSIPGYVVAIVASIVIGGPIKWIESRIENISTTGFARDYHMDGELAADEDGRIMALRFTVLADHGAFDSRADPTKFPAGLFNICSGSYDIPKAYCRVEARLHQQGAGRRGLPLLVARHRGGLPDRADGRHAGAEAGHRQGRDPRDELHPQGAVPVQERVRLRVRLRRLPDRAGEGARGRATTRACAPSRPSKRADRTRDADGHRPRAPSPRSSAPARARSCDILGIGMFDSCEIRVQPHRQRDRPHGHDHAGPGPPDHLRADHRDRAGPAVGRDPGRGGRHGQAPYGLGTYGSRSTPVGGAAVAMAARKIHAKARKIAAHLLEVGEGDLDWEIDRFKVKGDDAQFKTMKDIAWAAHTSNLPAGLEPGLEAVHYYDPPNFTFPFGIYLCVVDIDRGTGETKVRRFYALDDCGTRINPMIIEGQIHGGLTEGFAVAMGQQMPVRRAGQPARQHPDGLLPADRGRDAALGNRPHGDALAAPSDRRQGRGRVAARGRHSRPSPPRWSMPSRTSGSRTWTCRTPRSGCGSNARRSGVEQRCRNIDESQIDKTYPMPSVDRARLGGAARRARRSPAACPARRSPSRSTHPLQGQRSRSRSARRR